MLKTSDKSGNGKFDWILKTILGWLSQYGCRKTIFFTFPTFRPIGLGFFKGPPVLNRLASDCRRRALYHVCVLAFRLNNGFYMYHTTLQRLLQNGRSDKILVKLLLQNIIADFVDSFVFAKV